MRTRFLDDLVLDGCAHGCRQVVILGAGLDARAFRLAFPSGVRLFELDLPGILAFKAAVVRRPAGRRRASASSYPATCPTTGPRCSPLPGSIPTVPTVWLAEGLLVYLTAEQNEMLMDAVSAQSAVGSRFGLTLSSRDEPPRDVDPGDHESLFRSASPGDAAAWLGPRGWTVEVHTAAERADAYGRIDVPSRVGDVAAASSTRDASASEATPNVRTPQRRAATEWLVGRGRWPPPGPRRSSRRPPSARPRTRRSPAGASAPAAAGVAAPTTSPRGRGAAGSGRATSAATSSRRRAAPSSRARAGAGRSSRRRTPRRPCRCPSSSRWGSA